MLPSVTALSAISQETALLLRVGGETCCGGGARKNRPFPGHERQRVDFDVGRPRSLALALHSDQFPTVTGKTAFLRVGLPVKESRQTLGSVSANGQVRRRGQGWYDG